MTETKARPLLTEAEVARRLHGSIRKVQRLRRERLLAFIPGRPVLIDEADLEDYLFRQRQASVAVANGPPTAVQMEAARQQESTDAHNLARKLYRLRQIGKQHKR